MDRWKEVIIITVLIRVLLLSLPIISSPSISNLFYSWVRWDGPHYIDIAKNGYQTTGEQALFIVFYPLYPLLIKIVAFFMHDFLASSILVSLFFSLTASILLFEITLLDFNRRTALLAVWFLNIFPTSFFLQASYTESLYLTLSLSTVYFYRRRSYLSSSITGILSTMTRINGILLLPLLFFETKLNFDYQKLITILCIPFGFLIYLLINYFTFGEFLYFTRPLLSNWYKKPEWPWIGIDNLIKFANSQTGDYYYLFWGEVAALIIIVFFTVVTFLKIRKSYGVYMLLNLILFISTNFIMSTPRYTLILFPIFIALALINNKFLLTLISLIFLVMLFPLTYLYTQGRWAY